MLGTQTLDAAHYQSASLTPCVDSLSLKCVSNAASNAWPWKTMTAHSESRSEEGLHTCVHLFDRLSLKMVLGCTLGGLAKHALYMHMLPPSKGHVLG